MPSPPRCGLALSMEQARAARCWCGQAKGTRPVLFRSMSRPVMRWRPTLRRARAWWTWRRVTQGGGEQLVEAEVASGL